jgi:hypothetical protein
MSGPGFESLLSILWAFGRLVPALFVTLACVIYLVKSKSVAGVLMLIGNLLGILMNIVSVALAMSLRARTFDTSSFLMFSNITQFVSIIAALLFAAGLFALVANLSETGR